MSEKLANFVRVLSLSLSKTASHVRFLPSLFVKNPTVLSEHTKLWSCGVSKSYQMKIENVSWFFVTGSSSVTRLCINKKLLKSKKHCKKVTENTYCDLGLNSIDLKNS